VAKSPRLLANYDADYARTRRRRRLAKPGAALLVIVVLVAVIGSLGHSSKPSTTPTTYPTKLLSVAEATTPTVLTDHSTCGAVAALGELLASLKSSVSGVPSYVAGEQNFYENYEQAFAIDDSAADVAIETTAGGQSPSLTTTTRALGALALAQHNFSVSMASLTNPTPAQLAAPVSQGESQVSHDITALSTAWSKESLRYNC
jgi:hypothetical protein